jgi:hypothetical protein
MTSEGLRLVSLTFSHTSDSFRRVRRVRLIIAGRRLNANNPRHPHVVKWVIPR